MKNKYRIIEAQGHYARNRYLTIYRIVCDWDGRACQMSGEYRTRREACAAIAKLKIAQCEKEAWQKCNQHAKRAYGEYEKIKKEAKEVRHG